MGSLKFGLHRGVSNPASTASGLLWPGVVAPVRVREGNSVKNPFFVCVLLFVGKFCTSKANLFLYVAQLIYILHSP